MAGDAPRGAAKVMSNPFRLKPRFFYTTAALPCPYLPGRLERRLVTDLDGRDAVALHDRLSQAGFRRSHGVAYAPACRDCSACVAVRIRADAFRPSRGQQRLARRNADLSVRELPPRATAEQYALFRKYQQARHRGGEMARMDFFDYQLLVEDTPVDTAVVEFREPTGGLIAACVVDRMQDGFSAVYSFFDPDEPRRSLGTAMILHLVEAARVRDVPHVYLGFWIAECRKMAYKARFHPVEILTAAGWQLLRGDADGQPGQAGTASRPPARSAAQSFDVDACDAAEDAVVTVE